MLGYHLRDSGSVDPNWGSGSSIFNIFPGRMDEKRQWGRDSSAVASASYKASAVFFSSSFLRVLSGKSLPSDSWHLWGQF